MVSNKVLQSYKFKIKQFFFVLLIVSVYSFQKGQTHYSLDLNKIELYRKKPIISKKLSNLIQTSDEFISLTRNKNISEGILEHHLIDEIKQNEHTTSIIFEYFSMEGLTCSIKAVTVDEHNNIKSIIRLAEYEEYPDGKKEEFTIIENDTAKRTTVTNGVLNFNDTTNQIIMRCDSIILTYKLNQFKKFEPLDSLYIHIEYIK